MSQEPLPFDLAMNKEPQIASLPRVEFLLEESSMENVLRVILPQILPQGYALGENCFLRPHNGKHDLQKSIPRKISAFSNPNNAAKIVILHDQDSSDCIALKQELMRLCDSAGTAPRLIRVVCRELESWYIGDPQAIQAAYPRFHAQHYAKSSKFRTPDIQNASEELKRLVPDFQKGEASRIIPPFMMLERNISPSFQAFIQGLRHFLAK